MLRILERRLHINALPVCRLEAELHQRPVRDDVHAPLPEVRHFVLPLADDDLDSFDRFLHPVRLAAQPRQLFRRSVSLSFFNMGVEFRLLRWNQRLHLGQLCLPERDDALIHPPASNLVDAHQHGFAGFPASRAMLNEIGRQLVQSVVGGDDLIILP